jgi:biopolymer transport protein ExbD
MVEVPRPEPEPYGETVVDYGNLAELAMDDPTPPPVAIFRTPAPPPVTPVKVSTSVEVDVEPEPPFRLQRKRQLVEAEMDMTPMVDVTFLLLIFFMVTAVFTLQKTKEIPKPQPRDDNAASRSFQQLEDNPDVITVHVEPLGTYRVITADWDREAFSEPQLLRQLKEARSGLAGGNIPTHLLVRADGEAAHEKVVAALDAGTAVGVEDIQVLTVESEEAGE